MCVFTAPNLFDQDEDGRVLVRAEGALNEAELDAARQAVALCPSGALSLHESTDDMRGCEPQLDAVALRNDRRAASPSARTPERK